VVMSVLLAASKPVPETKTMEPTRRIGVKLVEVCAHPNPEPAPEPVWALEPNESNLDRGSATIAEVARIAVGHQHARLIAL
jgi:hypothetical protein